MRFSERYGYDAPRLGYQGESMDDALRGDLWNALYTFYFNARDFGWQAESVWRVFFHKPQDLCLPDKARTLARDHMLEASWAKAYDLVEHLTTIAHNDVTKVPTTAAEDFFHETESEASTNFLSRINTILDQHRAGWHVLGGKVVPITDQIEIEDVTAAGTALDGRHPGAAHHLRAAISALADRDSPQYANSMRESFLAVEGVAKAIAGTPKGDLAKALRQMKGRGSGIDTGLINYWDSVYGKASGPSGLRHAGALAPDFNAADARYMLVTASAFINLMLTYDTHNAAVGYVPESEIPPWERPGFTTDSPPAGAPPVTS